MKIVLNRKELKAITAVINTLEKIDGVKPTDFMDNFKVSKKAYLASLITGELTIDINEECISEYFTIINTALVQVTPAIKSISVLLGSMIPVFDSYNTDMCNWQKKYSESSEPENKTSWEVSSINIEREVV